MGIVQEEVTFDGSGPELSRIAEKMSSLAGLSIVIDDADHEVKGNLFELRADLAFECEPLNRIEIFSYQPGAARRLCEESFGDNPPSFARLVTGLNERADTQVVYLRGFVGQEPTLLMVAKLALETLGGRPVDPITEEDRLAYALPVRPEVLASRQKALTRKVYFACFVQTLLLPVLIPIWFVFHLPMLGWRLLRSLLQARRADRK